MSLQGVGAGPGDPEYQYDDTGSGPEVGQLEQALESTFAPTPEQLSGVAVVIIIAVGVQTLIMLFIFAKRQIMRFTLRSRRGPHVSVGQGSYKQLRREIDRRLDYVHHIRYEPKLLRQSGEAEGLPHHYRAKALDEVQVLDTVLSRYSLQFSRPAGANLRAFLIECLAGPLVGLEPGQIHRFCDLYDLARHSYKPFGQREYNNFHNFLLEIKELVWKNREKKPILTPKKVHDTPQHRKVLNRPRKKVWMSLEGDSYTTHRSSSAVLISDDTISFTDTIPTPV